MIRSRDTDVAGNYLIVKKRKTTTTRDREDNCFSCWKPGKKMVDVVVLISGL